MAHKGKYKRKVPTKDLTRKQKGEDVGAGGSIDRRSFQGGTTFREVEDVEAERTRVNRMIAERKATDPRNVEEFQTEKTGTPVRLPRGSFSALSNEDKAKLVTAGEFYGGIEKVPANQVGSYFTREDLEARQDTETREEATEEREAGMETRTGFQRDIATLMGEERDPNQIVGEQEVTITNDQGIEETLTIPYTNEQLDAARREEAGREATLAGVGAGGVGKIGSGIQKGGAVAEQALTYKKAIDKVKSVKAINEISKANKISTEEATKLFEASKKGGLTTALTKLTKIAFSGKVLGLQFLTFWANADTVASFFVAGGSRTTLNSVKFSGMSEEDAIAKLDELQNALDTGNSATNIAAWINPVMGYAHKKFYHDRIVTQAQAELDSARQGVTDWFGS